MIYNANLIITNRCNSKCTNCSIWKEARKEKEMTIEEIEKLFSIKELRGLTELGISGGEPFLRNDLVEVLEAIFKINNNIEKIYLTTNASMKKNVKKVCKLLEEKNKKLCLGISIDGDREINQIIRGVDSYNNAIELIKEIKENYPTVDVQISFTICKRNCKRYILEHIKKIAKQLDCDYSFRIAEISEQYYRNTKVDNDLSKAQMKLVINFIIENKLKDDFMKEALYYYITGKVPIMYDYKNNVNKCEAGKSFVFIQADGKIYPCLYSNKAIGDINGFYKDIDIDYKLLKCPCMTECTVWPMIIKYKNNKEEKNDNK